MTRPADAREALARRLYEAWNSYHGCSNDPFKSGDREGWLRVADAARALSAPAEGSEAGEFDAEVEIIRSLFDRIDNMKNVPLDVEGQLNDAVGALAELTRWRPAPARQDGEVRAGSPQLAPSAMADLARSKGYTGAACWKCGSYTIADWKCATCGAPKRDSQDGEGEERERLYNYAWVAALEAHDLAMKGVEKNEAAKRAAEYALFMFDEPRATPASAEGDERARVDRVALAIAKHADRPLEMSVKCWKANMIEAALAAIDAMSPTSPERGGRA